MKNSFGNSITVTLFGESHGEYIGAVLDGLAPGIKIDQEYLRAKLALRRPSGKISTARVEADEYEIASGVFNGYTTGTPLCILIKNTNKKSSDYGAAMDIPRPGHADYTAREKYHGFEDHRGGGHFSGRLTAPLVFAGAVAKLALRERGIEVLARIRQIERVEDAPLDLASPDLAALREAGKKPFPVIDDECGTAMQEAILRARAEGDSVGGVIECFVLGLPAGVGGPDFDENLEGLIARHVFAVPAVKGIEFGTGFGLAAMRGSQANDAFIPGPGGLPLTRTNHSGGISGGIANGMPLIFRVAVKTTPSFAQELDSVDMRTGEAA